MINKQKARSHIEQMRIGMKLGREEARKSYLGMFLGVHDLNIFGLSLIAKMVKPMNLSTNSRRAF